MTFEQIKEAKCAFTHAGKFHSDDVFSAALLQIINPEIKIERGFQVPENYEGVVFDIGRGEFDHHQPDNEIRENEIPYASFGKLWRAIAPSVYGEKVYEMFDKSFIQPLDLSDNTGCHSDMANMIAAFNPVWNEENPDVDACFQEAVAFAKVILEKMLKKELGKKEADDLVLEAYEKAEDKRIIVLDRFMPFKKPLEETEAIYAIYPSQRGGYNAQGIEYTILEGEEERKELKMPFPEEWRGLEDDELPQEGIRFCHNSGFLIAADTVEAAIAACNYSIEKQQ